MREQDDEYPTYTTESAHIRRAVSCLNENHTNEAFDSIKRYLYDQFHFFTIRETDIMYLYNEGVYEAGGDSFIQTHLETLDGIRDRITSGDIREIITCLKYLTYRRPEEALEPPQSICVENGIININDDHGITFTPHTPKIIFYSKLPVTYQEGADCLAIKKFINEVVPEEDRHALIDVIAYCLIKSMPIHKAVILTGEGSNGKSTFIRLIKAFLGEKNISTVMLQDIAENRFAAADIFGKYANLAADISSVSLKQTGTFKMLMGDDFLRAEFKFKNGFSFKNTAKFIASANQIPHTSDQTDAFFRRIRIIPFPYSFRGREDTEILKKITAPGEMSGLLNLCLLAIPALLVRKDFANAKDFATEKKDYLRRSNSIIGFVDDMIEEDTAGIGLPKEDAHIAYQEYCSRIGAIPAAFERFCGSFASRCSINGIDAITSSIRVEGGRKRIWKGIKLLEKEEKKEAEGLQKFFENGQVVDALSLEESVGEGVVRKAVSDGEIYEFSPGKFRQV